MNCSCGKSASEHESVQLLAYHHYWYFHKELIPECPHCTVTVRNEVEGLDQQLLDAIEASVSGTGIKPQWIFDHIIAVVRKYTAENMV